MGAGSRTGLDRAREPGDSSDSLSGASHVLVSCERGRRREFGEGRCRREAAAENRSLVGRLRKPDSVGAPSERSAPIRPAEMSCAVSAVFGRPVALTPRRGAPASRRASSLRCEAAGIKTGKAVWRGENTKEVGNGEGFETEFLFDLGGETPAQVKDLRFKKDSEVVTVTIPRPLGIVFEEKLDGIYQKIVVDEVLEGSNASKADVKVGDVLRITTAVFNVPGVIDVTAWLNPPKSSNCKAFYVADQKPFDKVMDAIKSHAVPVDTPDGPMEVEEVGLVLERPTA